MWETVQKSTRGRISRSQVRTQSILRVHRRKETANGRGKKGAVEVGRGETQTKKTRETR